MRRYRIKITGIDSFQVDEILSRRMPTSYDYAICIYRHLNWSFHCILHADSVVHASQCVTRGKVPAVDIDGSCTITQMRYRKQVKTYNIYVLVRYRPFNLGKTRYTQMTFLTFIYFYPMLGRENLSNSLKKVEMANQNRTFSSPDLKVCIPTGQDRGSFWRK